MAGMEVEVQLFIGVTIAKEVPELLDFPNLIETRNMQIQVKGDNVLFDFVSRVVFREADHSTSVHVEVEVSQPTNSECLQSESLFALHLNEHPIQYSPQRANEVVLQLPVSEVHPFHIELLLLQVR